MTTQEIQLRIKEIDAEIDKINKELKNLDGTDLQTEIGQKLHAINAVQIKKKIELMKEKDALQGLKTH